MILWIFPLVGWWVTVYMEGYGLFPHRYQSPGDVPHQGSVRYGWVRPCKYDDNISSLPLITGMHASSFY